MAITVTQLTAFLAVLRGGSVTAAADELVVTQPSVSAAVAALGRELGCVLFERDGRGIRPTRAGDAFAPYAADVIGLLEQGRLAAREAGDIAAGRLTIATVATAAESFVPPLVRAFSRAHPDVELALTVGNRADVLGRVLSHAVDVAIGGRPPADDRLVAEAVMANAIVCVTAPDDPAAGGEPLSTAELSGRTWLLREPGSGTRALNEEFAAAHHLDPHTLTLGSNAAIMQAARAGLGIALLSRVAAQTDLDSGLLAELPLADLPPARPWFILRSAVGPRRAAVDAFVEFARAHIARAGQTA